MKRLEFTAYNLFFTRGKPEDFVGRLHHHNDVEVNFMTRGKAVYNLAGRAVALPLRRFAVFWGGIPHCLTRWVPGGEMWIGGIPLGLFLSWGLPNEKFVQPLLRGELIHEADPASADIDEAALRRWLHDLRPADRDEIPFLRAPLLLEVQARIHRLAFQARNLGARSKSADNSTPGVGRMLAHIAEHFRDPELSVARIARSAGLNKTYANECFRNACGMSLMRYVSQQRVAHAQCLLANTGAKVIDAALDSGFGSVSQFHHVFRAVTGTTPRGYARARENKMAPQGD